MRLGTNTSLTYLMAGAGCVLTAIYTDGFDGPRIQRGTIRGKPNHERDVVTAPAFDDDDQSLLLEHVVCVYRVVALPHAPYVDRNTNTMSRLGELGGMLRESPAA